MIKKSAAYAFFTKERKIELGIHNFINVYKTKNSFKMCKPFQTAVACHRATSATNQEKISFQHPFQLRQ